MTAQPLISYIDLTARVDPSHRARIARMVHEAVLTMRMELARDANIKGRACWPDYVYEREDYGNLAAIEELRDLIPPWRPTPAHIDTMNWIYLDVYGKWPNPRSGRNGLETWQWLLLELRAWQEISGLRGGWRAIAETIRTRPKMPRFSHEWARIEHERLVLVAYERALVEGRI